FIRLAETNCLPCRFTDIQRFICEMNGLDFDEWTTAYTFEGQDWDSHFTSDEEPMEINGYLFSKRYGGQLRNCGKITSKKRGRRYRRGYYCTRLLGYGFMWHKGILEAWCYKDAKKNWFVGVDCINKDFDVVLNPQKRS
ncbi:MAG: hypothetical protein ACW987_19980, partial [Candidatus Thorarchaeota archaeon]